MRSLGYHYLTSEKNEKFRMTVKAKFMNIASLITLSTTLLVGGVVVNGLTNALGKTDEEKTPIADSWLKAKSQNTLFPGARTEGQQVDLETTKGVVMLRGKVNSDAVMPVAENGAIEVDGVKSLKNGSEVVSPPLREVVGHSEDSRAMDIKERAAKFRGLHANRFKLMIMNSLFLSLMKP